MSYVAIAIGGSAVLGAGASYLGSRAQVKGAQKGADVQERMYYQTRADQAPWLEAGKESLGTLNELMKSGYFERPFEMKEDPGYQFRLGEGEKAIGRGAAARGDFFSGRAGKELARYGQDYASNEFAAAYGREMGERAQRYNRLAGIAGTGQTAAMDIGSKGAYAGNVMAQQYGAAGAARASGYTGAASALSSGVGSYMGYRQSQDLLSALK